MRRPHVEPLFSRGLHPAAGDPPASEHKRMHAAAVRDGELEIPVVGRGGNRLPHARDHARLHGPHIDLDHIAAAWLSFKPSVGFKPGTPRGELIYINGKAGAVGYAGGHAVPSRALFDPASSFYRASMSGLQHRHAGLQDARRSRALRPLRMPALRHADYGSTAARIGQRQLAVTQLSKYHACLA